MQINCNLTADDYREFQETYMVRFAGFWQRNLFNIFVSFGVIAILAGLNWILYLHRGKAYGILCVLCGLYLVWLGAWFRFWKWQRWFRKNAHLYTDLQYEIDENGVLTRTATEETRAKWQHYSKFAETQHLILLVDVRDSCLIFPKRAFNPAGLDCFRELLRRKVQDSA